MLPERIKNQVNTFVKENPSVDFKISISMDGMENFMTRYEVSSFENEKDFRIS